MSTLNEPKYDAIRWQAGNNDQEVKDFVQARAPIRFAPDEFTIGSDNGNDVVDFNAFHLVATESSHEVWAAACNDGQWLVFGPYWGDDPTLWWTPNTAIWDAIDDQRYQLKFS